MNAAKYIELDFHRAPNSVTALDSTEKLVMKSILETKPDTALQFVRGLRGELACDFRGGPCLAWFHDPLKPRIAQVLVRDPRKNTLLNVGNENDRIDSPKAAQLQRSNLLRSVLHENTSMQSLNKLAHNNVNITKYLTSVMTATYQSWAIPCVIFAPASAARAAGRERKALCHEVPATDSFDQSDSRSCFARAPTTPHRFRTKRQLPAYSGLTLKTSVSAEYRSVEAKIKRSRKLLAIPGLNQNHNHDLKNIFKTAAIQSSRVV
ncbi:MAG: hypothetical protein WA639_24545 [Candidatus Acidiferrum sp.]